MVGLSVILEGHHHHKSGRVSKKINDSSSRPQVINKTSMSVMASIYSTKLSPRSSSSSCSSSSSSSSSRLPSFPSPAFLEKCSLCKIKLLPGKDIYMYKGDRAFCSEECRCRQILMDEEETLGKDNCSMAAIKPAAAPSPSYPSSPASSRHRRDARNHRPGGFAY